MLHVDTDSDADLYVVTPPTYTQSIADGEVAVDAEVTRDEKPRVPEQSVQGDALVHTSPRPTSEHLILQPDARYSGMAQQAPPYDTTPASAYLTEPVVTAALVGTRACSIFSDQPAIWLVKRHKTALSLLAAVVLMKEGLVNMKDLELSASLYSTEPRTQNPPY
jgi:hypothetical protein